MALLFLIIKALTRFCFGQETFHFLTCTFTEHHIFQYVKLLLLAWLSVISLTYCYARNVLTAKFLFQGSRYLILRKTFSQFYRRHNELVLKFKFGLKSLLQQGLSEPEFYDGLVYRLRTIASRTDISDSLER